MLKRLNLILISLFIGASFAAQNDDNEIDHQEDGQSKKGKGQTS